jgi:hypothetical protein
MNSQSPLCNPRWLWPAATFAVGAVVSLLLWGLFAGFSGHQEQQRVGALVNLTHMVVHDLRSPLMGISETYDMGAGQMPLNRTPGDLRDIAQAAAHSLAVLARLEPTPGDAT